MKIKGKKKVNHFMQKEKNTRLWSENDVKRKTHVGKILPFQCALEIITPLHSMNQRKEEAE